MATKVKAEQKITAQTIGGEGIAFLIVEERPGNVVVFRLLAERLPVKADSVMIPLASKDPKGCPTPLTRLWEHDYHAIGSGQEYIDRVRSDVELALSTLNWEASVQTGYRLLPVRGAKLDLTGLPPAPEP